MTSDNEQSGPRSSAKRADLLRSPPFSDALLFIVYVRIVLAYCKGYWVRMAVVMGGSVTCSSWRCRQDRRGLRNL